MQCSHTRFVWLPAALFVLLAMADGDADVYNLKLLSNHAPDLTDIESFCRSTTSRWETNNERAAALAHWFGVMGNQSSPPADWIPVEPILHSATTLCPNSSTTAAGTIWIIPTSFFPSAATVGPS